MSSKILQGVTLILLLAVPISSLIGIDTSPLITTQKTFDCLKEAGYGFSNVRAFTLEGVDLDLSVKDTLIYSQKAGLRTQLFIRPCRGKNPKIQIDAVVLVIAEQYYEKLWLYLMDNPNVGCKWGTDYKANCEYVKEMLGVVKYFNQKSGIYTSSEFYKQIFGNYQCDLSDVPLIYADPDGSPSFQGYQKIGSWESPFGKMFQSNQYACGVNINKIFEANQANLVISE